MHEKQRALLFIHLIARFSCFAFARETGVGWSRVYRAAGEIGAALCARGRDEGFFLSLRQMSDRFIATFVESHFSRLEDGRCSDRAAGAFVSR